MDRSRHLPLGSSDETLQSYAFPSNLLKVSCHEYLFDVSTSELLRRDRFREGVEGTPDAAAGHTSVDAEYGGAYDFHWSAEDDEAAEGVRNVRMRDYIRPTSTQEVNMFGFGVGSEDVDGCIFMARKKLFSRWKFPLP